MEQLKVTAQKFVKLFSVETSNPSDEDRGPEETKTQNKNMVKVAIIAVAFFAAAAILFVKAGLVATVVSIAIVAAAVAYVKQVGVAGKKEEGESNLPDSEQKQEMILNFFKNIAKPISTFIHNEVRCYAPGSYMMGSQSSGRGRGQQQQQQPTMPGSGHHNNPPPNLNQIIGKAGRGQDIPLTPGQGHLQPNSQYAGTGRGKPLTPGSGHNNIG
jgi:hypothetical protein